MPTYATRPKPTPLGQLVYDARQRRGLNQTEFAALIGATRNEIATIETRNADVIYPALLDKLATLPDIDRDELYAAANRIPDDITVALRGSLDAIRQVRKVLGL